jgi:hypothetical protein
MNQEDLIPWIDRLKAEPDGKKRNTIVAELCKEKGLKIGDAWKLLKEAGFDPKAIAGTPGGGETNTADTNIQAGTQADDDTAKIRTGVETEAAAKAESEANAKTEAEAAAKAETKPVMLRHKTQYPKYRCAGLILTKKQQCYQITPVQLVKLKGDPWVEIEEGKTE